MDDHALSLREASPSTPAVVSFRLSDAPTADVRITITVSDQVSLNSPSEIVFTSSNWNVAQSVSVLPIDDLIHEGDHSGLIFLELASSDVLYNNLTSQSTPVNSR